MLASRLTSQPSGIPGWRLPASGPCGLPFRLFREAFGPPRRWAEVCGIGTALIIDGVPMITACAGADLVSAAQLGIALPAARQASR